MCESIFELNMQDDGIAVITIDLPGEAQNVLKPEFGEQVGEILEKLSDDISVKGVIIRSGKAGSFIAGADITVLNSVDTAEEAEEIAKTGQRLFTQLEKFKVPIVAADRKSVV